MNGYEFSVEGEKVFCMPVAPASRILGITKDALTKRGERGSHKRVWSEDFGCYMYEVPQGESVASARSEEAARIVPNSAHIFDPYRKKPGYLVRNGPDGALVNVTAERVWRIAQSLSTSSDIAAEFERRGIGAQPGDRHQQ